MLLDLNLLKVIHVKEFEEILEISTKRKVTLYDASYVLVAKKHKFHLVTDDKGMTAAATAEKVNVLNSDEFIRRFSRYFVIES